MAAAEGSVPLADVLSPGVEPGPAGLQPAALTALRQESLLRHESMVVDRRGIEPLTHCLPGNAAHQWRAAHESGTGESNPTLPGPKPGPVTEPVVPEAGRRPRTAAGVRGPA